MKSSIYIKCLLPLLLIFNIEAGAQSVAINNTGNSPNPAALLDIDASGLSIKKGLLIPRVTLAERMAMDPLPAPAHGLLVYQTDNVPGFYYNKSTSASPIWAYLSSGPASGWSLTGNSGTVDGTNFIGTTDNVPLNFRVNNVRAGRIENGTPLSGLTALGFEAGGNIANTSATAFGYRALKNNTGQGNTAVGWNALVENVNNQFSTALGAGALMLGNGGANTAVGYNALHNNVLDFNTGVGYNALLNNTGAENSAFGSSSLVGNTSGSQNTAFGFQALLNNTTGSYNSAQGLNALQYNTTGSYNTAIGALAGSNSANTAGNYNIFIGYNANSTGNLQNAIAIGKNALVSQSNSMVLGGTGVDAISVGVGTATPNSTLQVEGSVSTAIHSTSSDYTLTGDHHTLIITGAGGYTISLPAANNCVGRIYVLINRTASLCTSSISYTTAAGLPSSVIAANNSLWLQSDGTGWQQVK